jgi:hypothetical protein
MKKQNVRSFWLVISLLLFCHSNFARVDVPVKTTTFSVETEYGPYHFELHLPVNDESFTTRVVKILKEDTARVAKYFKYAPKDVVHFNLSEYDHEANGSATVFPIDQIVLRKFPPLGSEHLVTGADYMQGLVIHELIHIIHMDQTAGIPEAVRTIFGSIGKFGGVAPRWFIEGVATWGESKFTNGGRLRNKLMRLQWEEVISSDNFCSTIDCIDNPGLYPYRQFPYWTGAYFLEYLENEKEGSIECLIRANKNNIPFFLNSAFKECFGTSGTRMYEKFRNETLKRIAAKKEVDDLSPVSNVVATKDLSSGFTLVDGKIVTAEGDNKVRKIFVQNLKENTYEELSIAGRLSGIEKYDDTNIAIKSFINTRDKTSRTTEVYDNKELKELNSDGDYTFKFKDKSVVFKYNHFQWTINGSEYTFPRDVALSHLKRASSGVFFKLFDVRDNLEKLAFYSINDSKVRIVKSYKLPFSIVETCSDQAFIKKDNGAFLVSARNEMKLKSSILDRTIEASFTDTESAVVLENSKSGLYHWNKGCKDFEKMKTTYKRVTPGLYEPITKELDRGETKDKSYPGWAHFVPRYWFFDYTAETDSLSAWGINTAITDPERRHTLSLRAVFYSEINEIAPDVSYTYEFPHFHFLNVTHQKTYSSSSLRSTNDSQDLTLLSYGKKFELKHYDIIASLYGGYQKVDDFISTRNEKEYGVLLKSKLLRTQFDDFWQEFSFKGRFFNKEVSQYDGYNGLQSILSLDVNLFENFYFFGSGSYSALDKNTFTGGVLYGGGNYTDFHQFYGLPYSEIFGNEIKSARGGFKLSALEVYRGSGLIPIFLEEVHVKGGADYIAADRIIVGNDILFNKSTKSFWGGVQIDFTIAYAIPMSIDVIKSLVKNDYGEDVSSTSTIITGGLDF